MTSGIKNNQNNIIGMEQGNMIEWLDPGDLDYISASVTD